MLTRDALHRRLLTRTEALAAAAGQRLPWVTRPAALDALGMALVLAAALPLWSRPAARYPIPVGFAGLYATMADEIAAHGFALPAVVPYYAPDGLPFAYPPLGLYLMAFCVHVLHVPLFTYLRLAPLVLLIISIVPTHLLAKELTGSRVKATLATALIALSTDLLYFHLGAAGAVRALASFWTIWGLLFTWWALRWPRARTLVSAAICFGLTILTHPSNALFFVLSLVVFVLVNLPNLRRAALAAAAILAGGLAVSAPWMLAVVQRHGASVFADASTTHGGRPGLSMEALRLQGLRAILVGLPVVGSPTTVHAAAILGTFYGAATGRWLWPLWLVATVLFALDKYRFVMLIGGMAAAVLVVDLFGLAWRRSADSPGSRVTRVASVAAAAGLLGFHLYVYAAQWPRQVQPLITQSEIEMATWVPQHTPATARLLVIQRQHPPESDRYQDSLEWFPYLTRRVMLGVPWGHEWTGDIAREEFLLTVFTRCWAQESLTCFDDTTRRLERQPDYLLLLNPADVAHLAQEIASSGRWVPVFENGGGSVWQRAGLAPGQSAAGSPG